MSAAPHSSAGPGRLLAPLYGLLLALGGAALAALAPLARYADPATPEGRFFIEHTTLFMPLYTLLDAQGARRGLLILLGGAAWYGLLALLYTALLRRSARDPALADALWRSRLHWLLLAAAYAGALLAFPLLSDDALYYLYSARAWLRGLNPFLPETVAAMRGDPWRAPMGGDPLPLIYGPLWLYLSLAPAWLSGGALGPAMLGVKLVVLGLAGLCLLALWRLLADGPPEQRRRSLLALLWNPLLWAELAWNGHNDPAMLLWLLLALLLWRRGGLVGPAVLLALGVATKYVPLLLAAPLLAAPLRRLPDTRARLRALLLAGAAGAATLALLFAPVGAGPQTLSGLLEQGLRVNVSLGALLRSLAAAPLGARGAGLLAAAAMLALVAWATRLAWRGAPPAELWASLLLVYVLLFSTWVMPWYGLWLLVLAPLVRPALRDALLSATLGLAAYYLLGALPLPGWLAALLTEGLPLALLARAWLAALRDPLSPPPEQPAHP